MGASVPWASVIAIPYALGAVHGALGERHGDPHPLALSAGELVDGPAGDVGVPVASSASSTAARSADVHWRNQPWCG